tara:strand:+ start:414 stop:515 length:102 start_codon:yes stop_codon:yes gene_type:complete
MRESDRMRVVDRLAHILAGTEAPTEPKRKQNFN